MVGKIYKYSRFIEEKLTEGIKVQELVTILRPITIFTVIWSQIMLINI